MDLSAEDTEPEAVVGLSIDAAAGEREAAWEACDRWKALLVCRHVVVRMDRAQAVMVQHLDWAVVPCRGEVREEGQRARAVAAVGFGAADAGQTAVRTRAAWLVSQHWPSAPSSAALCLRDCSRRRARAEELHGPHPP